MSNRKKASSLNVMLCVEGLWIFVVANVLMVAGEAHLALRHGESAYLLFLAAHVLTLAVLLTKAILYSRPRKGLWSPRHVHEINHV